MAYTSVACTRCGSYVAMTGEYNAAGRNGCGMIVEGEGPVCYPCLDRAKGHSFAETFRSEIAIRGRLVNVFTSAATIAAHRFPNDADAALAYALELVSDAEVEA